MHTELMPAGPIQNNHRLLSNNDQNHILRVADIGILCHRTLDGDAVRQVAEKLVEHYEVLRTGYLVDAQGVMQQFMVPVLDVDYCHCDWTDKEDSQKADLKRQMAEQCRERGFGEPWLRLCVARVSDTQDWLYLALPGINVDGFSLMALAASLLKTAGQSAQSIVEQIDEQETIQYSELTPWLNDFMFDEDLQDAREYWLGAKTDAGFNDKFGLDRYLTGAGGMCNVRQTLGGAMAAIERLASAGQADCADVVCAGLRQVLASVAGQVSLSRVVDSRRDEALHEAIGPLSRAVPLYPEVDGSLAEQVAVEYQAREEAEDYTECFTRTFERQEQSFPFTFAALNVPPEIGEMGSIEVFHSPVEAAKLSFTLLSQGQASTLLCDFDSGDILPSSVERLVARLLSTLTGQQQCLQAGNSVVGEQGAPSQEYDTVVKWFDASAADSQGAIIDSNGKSLPLQQLQTHANKIAHYLLEKGVARGDRVALCLGRSTRFIAALLAVGKVGAAYVPVDIELPRARIQSMLSDSAPVLVICEDFAPVFEDGTAFEALDYADIPFARLSEDTPTVEVSADDMAYVLYTSGSTGKAKGVGINHRALFNHMAWMHRCFDYQPEDIFLQRTSVSFDASGWEIWSPLLAQATMVIAPTDANLDLSLMVKVLRDNRVNILQMVPAQLQVLLEQPDADSLTGLRYLFCGGEALPAALASEAQKTFDCEVVNLYGPSECCIDSTFWRFDPALTLAFAPIGKPIDNVKYLVMKSDGNAAGAGEEGELYLAGDCVFVGYLGAQEMTQKATYIDPQGVRYYKSGDYVRVLDDENLYYIERLDNQIKINGFRIELEEISALVEQHRLAAKAVCLFCKTSSNLVLFSDSEHDEQQIEALLQANLPEYMVPHQQVKVSQWPYLSNGKVDNKALLAMAEAQIRSRYVAPESEIEKALVAIWQSALKTEQPIGTNSNFFQIGGHSLLAMKVVSGISDTFDVTVNLRDLFEYSTIAMLASHIETLKAVAGDKDLLNIEGVGDNDEVALEAFELDEPTRQSERFLHTPVYRAGEGGDIDRHLLVLEDEGLKVSRIADALKQDKVVLVKSIKSKRAAKVFAMLAQHFGLADAARQIEPVPVSDDAQSMVSHAQGSADEPLELGALLCEQAGGEGGERVLSLIDTQADIADLPLQLRTECGQLSALNGAQVATLWQEVTQSSPSFEHFSGELLKHLGQGAGETQGDSDELSQIARYFQCHVSCKMEADDLLLFNNRIWMLAACPWGNGELGRLLSMYA